MAKSQYSRALAVFTYSKKPKNLKPGKVRVVRYRGKPVRVMLDKDGKRLKVLDAPKDVAPLIKKAETLQVVDGTLKIVVKEKPQRYAPKPPAPKPEPVKEEPEPPPPPEPKPKQAPPPPKPEPKPPPTRVTYELTDEERRKAMLIPVPDKGPIPTPYIRWDLIPAYCRVKDIVYVDYPIPQAPKGLLPELREMFRRNRIYQNRAPVNVLIWGPPGTGKSEVVKKFAEDTGLPYWHIIGEAGLKADELIGHWELRDGRTVWVEGVIPKAVKLGGILHFDEANLLEPDVLARLNELMDSKRQLTIKETGEIIKAHPDLFIIFTINPPVYQGLKALPEQVRNRLTKRYWLDYPPPDVEFKIIKEKLKLSDAELKPPTKNQPASGTLAKDIADVMKIISNLRKQQDLSYIPSIRDVQSFVQDLKEGDDFFTAFDRNIKAAYYGEEVDRIEEALKAVRPR